MGHTAHLEGCPFSQSKNKSPCHTPLAHLVKPSEGLGTKERLVIGTFLGTGITFTSKKKSKPPLHICKSLSPGGACPSF